MTSGQSNPSVLGFGFLQTEHFRIYVLRLMRFFPHLVTEASLCGMSSGLLLLLVWIVTKYVAKEI